MLSGLPENKIKIIKGKRVLPDIGKPSIENCTLQDIEKSDFDLRAKYKFVHNLRSKIIDKNVLTLSEIAKPLNLNEIEDQLNLIDVLSETKVLENALFPVRGHFFSRGIGGVFVCTNPNCDKHGKFKPESVIGTMSTIASKKL